MMIDLNECPLCGGRKTNDDFCAACTAEIEAADPHWFCARGVNDAFRRMAAINILYRNGRLGHYYQRAREQAARRSERWMKP